MTGRRRDVLRQRIRGLDSKRNRSLGNTLADRDSPWRRCPADVPQTRRPSTINLRSLFEWVADGPPLNALAQAGPNVSPCSSGAPVSNNQKGAE